jgi:hypothetical protein
MDVNLGDFQEIMYPEILSSGWLIKNKHLKKAVIEVNLLKRCISLENIGWFTLILRETN